MAADPAEEVRKDILAAVSAVLDALQRGDADAALQMDTNDWISVVVGQKPRTRQELEPFIRRDVANHKKLAGLDEQVCASRR